MQRWRRTVLERSTKLVRNVDRVHSDGGWRVVVDVVAVTVVVVVAATATAADAVPDVPGIAGNPAQRDGT